MDFLKNFKIFFNIGFSEEINLFEIKNSCLLFSSDIESELHMEKSLFKISDIRQSAIFKLRDQLCV